MNFSDIDNKLGKKNLTMAVCLPEDENSIEAVYEAYINGFANAIMVGCKETIESLLLTKAPKYKP